MDNARFDALARALSTGHTRRSLSRFLGGLSLASVLSALGTPAAAVGTRLGGAPCTKNSQCQTNKCFPNSTCSCSTTVGCKRLDDPCQKAVCKTDTGRCVNRNKCTVEAPATCGRTGECTDGTCQLYSSTTDCATGKTCGGGTCACSAPSGGGKAVGDACDPRLPTECTSGVCGCNGIVCPCTCRNDDCVNTGGDCTVPGTAGCCTGICSGVDPGTCL